MTGQPLPEPLPEDVLARRNTLPLKPEPVTLTGRYVRLEPLVLERDVEPLYAVSNGQAAKIGGRSVDAYDPEALIWRYMFAGPFATLDEFAVHLRGQVNAANALCFCVFDLNTGHPVGVYNYMSNMPEHLKIELGGIWFSPLAQRTNANLEATYLTLAHAFHLGYRRLEWKCNALNERSRKAALRMGFKFEGIQEAHVVIKNRNRDTAWFRILDSEWQGVKAKLENLLYP
jgi:RimJ/RimL family protein N-acetyltransferase